MKKQLLVVLGLSVLATPAFATKARLEALGEDNFGSYYINDNRNQFLNPAKINDAKDLVTYEFGASSTGAPVGSDSAGSPKAEGGFNKSWNNLVMGLHFGNVTPLASTVRALPVSAAGNASNLQERNTWDAFIGGDNGIKWGANLTYENTNTGGQGGTQSPAANRLSSNALRARLGAIMGDLEVLGQVSLQGDAKDYQGGEVVGRSSWLLGAGYMVNNYKLIADWRHVGGKYTQTAVAGNKEDFKFDEFRLGVARQERLNDKAIFYGKAMLERRTVENDGAGTAGGNFYGNADQTRYVLPVTAGLEYDATSWLQLRGSVSQYVWSQNKVNNNPGTTTNRNLSQTVVRAGASLKFGEFTIDGLVSTSGSGNTSAGNLDTTPTTNGGNGSLRTDSLLTRVSMTYRF
jgi:hypothetical protein